LYINFVYIDVLQGKADLERLSHSIF